MGIAIEVEQLASRLFRKVATGGKLIREVGSNYLQKEEKGSDGGNIVTNFFSSLAGMVGSILGEAFKALGTLITWTFTGIWSLCVTAFQFLWTFNWNIADQQLDQAKLQAKMQLVGALGNLAGQVAGYLVCGALPGAIITVFNEAMGEYVLQKLGEEALRPIASNIAQVIQITGNTIATYAFAWMYKDVRNFFRESDDSVKTKLKAQGLKDADVNKSLSDRDKPWSFAQKFQEKISEIKNPVFQTFVQQFFAQFGNSCIEAGYVVAGAVDSYIATQRSIVTEGVTGDIVEVQTQPDGSTKVVKLAVETELQAKPVSSTTSSSSSS